jgi:hypothetical protein
MHFNFEIRPPWAGFQNPSACFMDVCVAVFCPALVCPVRVRSTVYAPPKEIKNDKIAPTHKSVTHALQP